MAERNLRVAVVIPALNEEANIEEVVRRTRDQVIDWVIVADNGSTDRTAEAARAAGATVTTERRRGYGYACATGSAEAVRLGADVIAYLDGDLSSPPDELPRILEPLHRGTADLVLGSRVRGHVTPGAMAIHQRFGNWLSALLIRRLYDLEVTDHGPFRAIRTELLIEMDMTEMTFGWPTEMTVKCANRGATVVEVPVSWLPRRHGRSKVSGTIRGSVLAARHIVGVTLRHAALPERLRGVSRRFRVRC